MIDIVAIERRHSEVESRMKEQWWDYEDRHGEDLRGAHADRAALLAEVRRLRAELSQSARIHALNQTDMVDLQSKVDAQCVAVQEAFEQGREKERVDVVALLKIDCYPVDAIVNGHHRSVDWMEGYAKNTHHEAEVPLSPNATITKLRVRNRHQKRELASMNARMDVQADGFRRAIHGAEEKRLAAVKSLREAQDGIDNADETLGGFEDHYGLEEVQSLPGRIEQLVGELQARLDRDGDTKAGFLALQVQLYEHLSMTVRCLHEASGGDGVRDEYADVLEASKALLNGAKRTEAEWEHAAIEVAQLREAASRVPGLTAEIDEARADRGQLASIIVDLCKTANVDPSSLEDGAETLHGAIGALSERFEAAEKHAAGAWAKYLAFKADVRDARRLLSEAYRAWDSSQDSKCGKRIGDACRALDEALAATQLVPNAPDATHRNALRRAIRRIAVDMPDGSPNCPAEALIPSISNAIIGREWDELVKLWPALLEALADDCQALREAADAYFGEDFSTPEKEASNG